MSGITTPLPSGPNSSICNATSSAISKFVSSPELMEQVFLFLSFPELLGAQRVCKLWKSIQSASPKIQQLLWKKAKFVEEGQNPHFPERSDIEYPDWMTEPDTYLPGRLEYFKLLFNEVDNYQRRGGTGVYHHDLILAVTHHVFPSSETLNTAHAEASLFTFNIDGPFGQQAWIPNDGLKSLICRTCGILHHQFDFSHLHPVLRFFEDLRDAERYCPDRSYICMQGIGSDVFMNTMFPGFLGHVPNRGYPSILEHCKKLKKAWETIEQSGLQDDFFMQPVATKLIMANGNRWPERDLERCRGHSGGWWKYDLKPHRFPSHTEVYTKDHMITESDGIRLRHIMPLLLFRYHRIFDALRWTVLENYLSDLAMDRPFWALLGEPFLELRSRLITAKHRSRAIEIFKLMDELEDMMGELWFRADEDGNRLEPVRYELVHRMPPILRHRIAAVAQRFGVDFNYDENY